MTRRERREVLLGESIRLLRTRTIHEALADAVAVTTAVGLLAYVAVRAAHGVITVGELVVFYAAVHRGQGMFNQLSNSLSTLLQGSLFLSHLYDFLDLQPRVLAPAQPRPVPALPAEGLCFDGVTHVYEGARRPALAGVQLTIRPGERIALVGRNGAGKSTLIKLMMRLYDPTAGRITLDGVDLRAFDPEDLRARFAVVVQDHISYELPAGESIALGDIRTPPAQARIEGARRRRARAHHAPARGLRNAARALLRGRRGAQRRRAAAGRAGAGARARRAVRDPRRADERDGRRGRARAGPPLRRGHRRPHGGRRQPPAFTVRAADRIVVMEDGSVVETGTHEELMERGDVYAALFTDLRGAPPLPSG